MSSCSILNWRRRSSLPVLPRDMRNLSSLTLWTCSKFTALPESLGRLKNLKYLSLSTCSSLEEMPKGLGTLTSLHRLDLLECSSLVPLPKELGNLSSLPCLDLLECYSLEALPKELGNWYSLRRLDLLECSSLVASPKELGNFSSLSSLNFSLWTTLPQEGRTSRDSLFFSSVDKGSSRQASFTGNYRNRRKRKSCQLADRASQLGDESDVPGGVYRRAVKDTRGSVTHYKYEPRFKPRREKLESGTTLEFNYLPLGSYDTPREAEIVRHIALVLYGKEEGRPVQFESGLCLPFPSATEPQNCPPSGKEKAVWVAHKTKELYAELLQEKASRLQLLYPALATGSHHGHDVEACRSVPSASAHGAGSIPMELTYLPSPHGGNGVVEQAIISECHGLGLEPPLAPGVFSPLFSDSDVDQVISLMPQLEEIDFPAIDDLDQIGGDNSETDRFFGLESTLVPPQSSALDVSATAIVARRPQLGSGDQGLEVIEPQLNSATAITFQQLEALPEQVQLQLRVTCQEQRLEDFSGSHVELQQKLLEYKVEISELQQKLRKSEVENEKWKSMFYRWRSMFGQFAKMISASDEDRSPVDMQ